MSVKKISKKIAVCFILAAVSLFCLSGCSSGSVDIDISKYVYASCEGYDGSGTLDFSFNTRGIKSAYGDEMKFSSSLEKEMKKVEDFSAVSSGEPVSFDNLAAYAASGNYSAIDLFDDLLSGSFDKTKNLSNGDKPVFTLDNSQELESCFNCSLENVQFEFTVNTLTEIEEFDPFDFITVSFKGMSPNVYTVITKDNEDDIMGELTFTSIPSVGLSNGDIVTIQANASDMDSFKSKYGKDIAAVEKQYKVEVSISYAMSLAEIPEDMMEKMKTQADNAMIAYAAKNYDANIQFDTEYLGNYFISAKDPSSADGDIDVCYFVYKCSVYEPSKGNTYEFYDYIGFSDIIILADGVSSVDLDTYKTTSDTLESTKYRGYSTLDSLFRKCVIQYIDKYDYEEAITEPEPEPETEADYGMDDMTIEFKDEYEITEEEYEEEAEEYSEDIPE